MCISRACLSPSPSSSLPPGEVTYFHQTSLSHEPSMCISHAYLSLLLSPTLLVPLPSPHTWHISRFGTLSDYFTALDESLSKSPRPLPSLSGDFFTYADLNQDYWTGYFTTRPFWKATVRKLEAAVRAADILFALSAAADVAGVKSGAEGSEDVCLEDMPGSKGNTTLGQFPFRSVSE